MLLVQNTVRIPEFYCSREIANIVERLSDFNETFREYFVIYRNKQLEISREIILMLLNELERNQRKMF